jgi:ABC-type Fe3+ transport system permease subunit
MYVRLDLVRAMLFALIQLLLSLGFMLLSNPFMARFQVERTKGHRSVERRLGELPLAGRLLILSYGLAILVFLVGPLLTMAGRAFVPRAAPTLESFRALFVPQPGGRDVPGIVRSSIPRVFGTSIATAGSCRARSQPAPSIARRRARSSSSRRTNHCSPCRPVNMCPLRKAHG